MNMIDKVLALAAAGYNKDEISQLLAVQDPEPEHQPEPAPAPDPEPAPAPAPQPEPAPAPVPTPAPQAVPSMDALNDRLDKLIKRMEQDAITRSSQPPQETVDDILASIIRPKRKE